MESSPTASSSYSNHHRPCQWTRGRCIGRGSFAKVHIATYNNHNTFAVKSTPLLSNSTQLNSLNNEIQILQKLYNSINPSPYIIQYLGNDTTSSENGTAVYRNLHLEYLPSGTVSEQSSKTEHLVRSYTRCLVAALTHLHSRNIVHCDVKGRNVLVGNKYGECKLADFGSAFEICGAATAGAIVPQGSPLWMAPEVLRGEYQGPESDVWSLGCTVIEMLTGKVNRGGGDTVWQMAFSDTTPEIPAGVSDEGRDFLDKCLRRERKERWSCQELMKHPFVAAVGFESLTWSNTPRCVLDEFESKFDGFEEMGSDSVLGLETASLGTSSAIEKLCYGGCGGGGFEWDDDNDGWLTVRRGMITEYSDFVTEMGEDERMEMEETQGSSCNSSLGVQLGCCWAGHVGLGLRGGFVCGYELKDVFGFGFRFSGVLCTLSFCTIIMLLLTTFLFITNNYWRILERLLFGVNGDSSLVWLFLVFSTTKKI